jgi:hypothetical protein
MEVRGQLHAPAALPPGKEHLGGRLGGSQSLFGRGDEEEKTFPCWKSNSSRPARSPVAVLTELPRLLSKEDSIKNSKRNDIVNFLNLL